MSDAAPLRSFVLEALADLGATVSEGDSLLWVQLPERLQSDLEAPATLAITFDPERSGDFEAELIAPGSYFLEKLVALACRRGRWDAARHDPRDPDWVANVLVEAGLGPDAVIRRDTIKTEEEALFLLSFRVTLTSDEKRESLHFLAVSPSDGSAWAIDPSTLESGLIHSRESVSSGDLDVAYRLGASALREETRDAVDPFRSASLRLLEEEVRRIFGYFDQTIESIREADPEASQDLLRAIQAERDRRLTETLERFDPKAKATLCAIRVIRTPAVHLRLHLPGGQSAEVTVDAWSHRVRGLRCASCGGSDGPWRSSAENGIRCAGCATSPVESARPRVRPRSGIPRRGTRAGRGAAQSPRGSTERSRAASSRRRGP